MPPILGYSAQNDCPKNAQCLFLPRRRQTNESQLQMVVSAPVPLSFASPNDAAQVAVLFLPAAASALPCAFPSEHARSLLGKRCSRVAMVTHYRCHLG